jgi:hypothetical protein
LIAANGARGRFSFLPAARCPLPAARCPLPTDSGSRRPGSRQDCSKNARCSRYRDAQPLKLSISSNLASGRDFFSKSASVLWRGTVAGILSRDFCRETSVAKSRFWRHKWSPDDQSRDCLACDHGNLLLRVPRSGPRCLARLAPMSRNALASGLKW